MQIAILGAGLSGLALCWHLLQQGGKTIKATLFDSQGIGKGASGIATGLLHPYGGMHAKRAWSATQGMKSTIDLLNISQQALSESIADDSGILRPAQTLEQCADFYSAAQKYDDLEWWDQKKCEKIIPGIKAKAGLFIKSGVTVHTHRYLEGLWNACSSLDATLEIDSIAEIEELKSFDVVIVAAGAGTKQLTQGMPFSLFHTKGQIIELSWPAQLAPLPMSLVSKSYIVMQPDLKSCLVGATYERNFLTPWAEPNHATVELLEKASSLLPELAHASILSYRAGVRVCSADNRIPIVGPVAPNTWIFTGLGSKGLLYHAWLADLCSQAILSNNPLLLPPEVRRFLP